MRIRQSLCVPCYLSDGLSLDELFREVRRIGYAGVEYWDRGDTEQFEQTIALAKRHDLVVASMCGHRSLPDGLNRPENHERIEAELRESIDLAARHGIAGLICFSGNRNPGQSDFEGLVACARGLKRVARYAEERRVNLNVELLNSRVDHPGYQCDHTDWGVALCEMVGSARVKLLYDIYHMQIMEGDLIRSIRKHIGHIGHFHTAGNPGRRDFDDTQELNYRGICSAIAETGYEGFVAHEFRAKGNAVEGLRTAFEICNVS